MENEYQEDNIPMQLNLIRLSNKTHCGKQRENGIKIAKIREILERCNRSWRTHLRATELQQTRRARYFAKFYKRCQLRISSLIVLENIVINQTFNNIH